MSTRIALTVGIVLLSIIAEDSFSQSTTPPPLSIISGNGQSALPNSELASPLVVGIDCNEFVCGPVNWSSTDPEDEFVQNPSDVTVISGISASSTNLTLGSTAGPRTITATDSSGLYSPVTFSIVGIAANASVAIISGNNQTGTPNSLLASPLTVNVTQDGVAAPDGTTVTWAVSGGGTLTSATTSTSGGQTSNTLTIGATEGPETVTASVAGGGAVTFAVNGALLSSTPRLDPIAGAVAGALDSACSNGGSPAMNDLCATVGALPDNEKAAALRQLAPMQISSQSRGALQGQLIQTSNINARIVALRAGTGTLFNFNRLSLKVASSALPNNLFSTLAQAQGNDSNAVLNQPATFSRLGIFMNGQFSFGDQNVSSRELSSDLRTQGVTGGIDYRFTDRLILGLAAGFMHVKSDFNRSGNLDTNGYTASVFGTYYLSDKFYLDGILTYGRNSYNSTRNISFRGFDASAEGRTHSNQYAASVTSGYNFHYEGLAFGPLVRANYVNVGVNSFRENGAGAANLAISSQSIESVTNNLGGQISYAISHPWGVFLPNARVEWEHQYANSSRLLTSTFVADPTQTFFAIPTNNPDRNYFNLASGITATFTNRATAFINYETVVGRQNITNHVFAVGGRWEF